MGQQQEKTVAEVLEAAASLIEPQGAWTQDTMFEARLNGTPCFCALGAITAKGGIGTKLSTAAREVLIEQLDGVSSSVVAWNDAPERTQAEVVAKLREAAAVARERGL